MRAQYELSILPRAARELRKLPHEALQRIRDACRGLASDPRPHESLRLSGRPGRRIRVGDYRVVHEVDEAARTVTVLHVGHRRDVYR